MNGKWYGDMENKKSDDVVNEMNARSDDGNHEKVDWANDESDDAKKKNCSTWNDDYPCRMNDVELVNVSSCETRNDVNSGLHEKSS
ncbi:hypothetical protein Y032_0046g1408 [Ancylostoma ceylanicum]|uniref:Uncharacterized protein n=1 Tax=Ancylostoma ceylanicum TaxID=53326 RepID=A0A016UD27_9BILA|nr:hypothetical protein Y032_0046g1408 [Ancylostoma ceylanicum]